MIKRSQLMEVKLLINLSQEKVLDMIENFTNIKILTSQFFLNIMIGINLGKHRKNNKLQHLEKAKKINEKI